MYICFPLRFKLTNDNDNDVAVGVIPANDAFPHWIRKINIVRYGDNKSIT